MPNDNLIKPKQLDPSIIDFIRLVTTGDIGAAIQSYLPTGYLGPNVLYISGTTQSVLGQKSFVLPITIPYSGGNSQTISKQYITDQVIALQSQISGLGVSSVLHTTGNESAVGTKTFDFVSGNILGFTGLALVPTINLVASPNIKSAVNLEFFYNQGILFNTGTQNIGGNKEFVLPPTILGDASSSGDAVKLYQLQSGNNWLQTQINALSAASGSRISGFGGVLSFNGETGNLFAVGRGTTTVIQRGNVMFISGNTPVLSGSGVYLQQGEQGLMGPYFNLRGPWQTGITYAYLDVISQSGVSWASQTGHMSSLSNQPGTGGAINVAPWYLLVSGGTGTQGIQGIQGAGGLAFNWRGTWLSTGNYISGDSIFYSGSSYATRSSASGINPTGSPWFVVAQAGSINITGGGVRNSVPYITANLTNNAYETGIAGLGKSFILQKVSTNVAARIRGYSNGLGHSGDLTRSAGINPPGNGGLLFEFITSPSLLTIYTSPMIVGSSAENTPSSNIPLTIENKCGFTTGISVTFSVTVLEN